MPCGDTKRWSLCEQSSFDNKCTETANSLKQEMCYESKNIFRNCKLLWRWRSELNILFYKISLTTRKKQKLNSWHIQASYIMKFLWQLPCTETWLKAHYTILTSQMVPSFTRNILHTTLYCTVKTWANILDCTNNTSHLLNLDVISMCTVVFQTRGREIRGPEETWINPISL